MSSWRLAQENFCGSPQTSIRKTDSGFSLTLDSWYNPGWTPNSSRCFYFRSKLFDFVRRQRYYTFWNFARLAKFRILCPAAVWPILPLKLFDCRIWIIQMYPLLKIRRSQLADSEPISAEFWWSHSRGRTGPQRGWGRMTTSSCWFGCYSERLAILRLISPR